MNDEEEGLKKGKNANFGEILLDVPKIWVKYMLIDKTIYVGYNVGVGKAPLPSRLASGQKTRPKNIFLETLSVSEISIL